jgi:hypothetical protein
MWKIDPGIGMTDEKPPDLPRIETIWVVLSADGQGEGIVAAPIVSGVLSVPLIGVTDTMVKEIMAIARMITKQTGQKMWLARFSNREDVQEIKP